MAARRRKRDGTKEAFWRQAFARQQASQLSICGWCRREGISEAGFYWWRRRLASQQPSAAVQRSGASARRGAAVAAGKTRAGVAPRETAAPFPAVAAFLPLQLAPSPAIEILLPDGVRLQVAPGVSADQLRQVLCALRAAAC